ncbi:MAG: cyclic nucleotide-binding domain-containing protein [Myxococcota bacterium]|nr:cyclic nucleotide-binding domain-containing protein [Myxococcota bacterium]
MSSFLDHMSDAHRKRMSVLADTRLVSAGQVLIERGERDQDFYRVEQGSLEVVDTTSRPQVVLDVLGAGTFVGEMAFITRQPRTAQVRAAEDAVVLCWKAAVLQAELAKDAELAAAFYKAAAQLLSQRLRATTRAATGGSLGRGESNTMDLGGARGLADRIKAGLLEVERLVREDERAARQELGAVAAELMDAGGRLFTSLGEREATEAGKLLQAELQPYLLRSRTGSLCAELGGGGAQVLAHVELGEATGGDALGRLLDRSLLMLPTAVALRARVQATVDAVESVLPEGRVRVLCMPVGPGTTIARLHPTLAMHGGEVTAADGNRDSLASLNTGGTIGTGRVRMRLLHEDLGLLAVKGSSTFFGPQNVVVLDGLAEYLPTRVLAHMLPALKRSLDRDAHLVINMLLPSRDHFVFDHLLDWRTLRRQPEPLLDLLRTLEFGDPKVVWQEGSAAVIVARGG